MSPADDNADLIDEDPPDVDVDPPTDDADVEGKRGDIPSYPIQKPPNMGGVVPTVVAKPMGNIEARIAFTAPAGAPSAADLALLTDALESEREALTQRVAAIEALLGFVAVSAELSVRVANIERFVGV
jgi:hypothetical protein